MSIFWIILNGRLISNIEYSDGIYNEANGNMNDIDVREFYLFFKNTFYNYTIDLSYEISYESILLMSKCIDDCTLTIWLQ